MADKAVPITFSVLPKDVERFNRLVEQFGGGNRSAFLRAAMDRMETAEIAEQLRELQWFGDRHGRTRGADSGSVHDRVRRVLNPNHDRG